MISLTAILVAADLIGARVDRPLLRNDGRRFLFVAIAAAGLTLYLSVSSILPLDVYRTGFSPFAPMVLAAAAIAVARRAPPLAWLALAILAALDLHLFRSRNLFDYALDPLVVAYAVGWCIVNASRR